MDIPKEFVPVLLVQIALFLGLWAVLRRLWFDPALKVIKARGTRTRGAVAEARTLRDEAERLRREYTAAVDEAKAEAQQEVQELLRQAEGEQRRMIAEATQEAQRTATEVRERVAREVADARQRLQADVQAIAREVAGAVLGRAV
jgi:F-type H+-transporting ATPase subunit b